MVEKNIENNNSLNSLEKVFFKNSKEQKLCGLISYPNSNSKSIVILVHGYSTSKDGISISRLRSLLSNNNINTFSIDLDGCGESEGDFENQTLSSALDDIEHAYSYIKSRGFTEVSLFGSSMAGPPVMTFALNHPEIKKLGLKAPVSDIITQRKNEYGLDYIENAKKDGFFEFTNSKSRTFKINFYFYEDAKNYVMKEKVKNIKVPTLILHGTNDKSVDLSFSKELIKDFPEATLIIIEGADHKLIVDGSDLKSNLEFVEWFK
ncbi:MAG: alpha/beta hydrolase [Candidatus Woesearchaeota archaeon]